MITGPLECLIWVEGRLFDSVTLAYRIQTTYLLSHPQQSITSLTMKGDILQGTLSKDFGASP